MRNYVNQEVYGQRSVANTGLNRNKCFSPMFLLFLHLFLLLPFLQNSCGFSLKALACLEWILKQEIQSTKLAKHIWTWFIWMFRETVWKRLFPWQSDYETSRSWEVGKQGSHLRWGRGCTCGAWGGDLRGFRAEGLEEGTRAELRGQ